MDIFKYLVYNKNDSEHTQRLKQAYAKWFITAFPGSEFSNEDRMMYEAIDYSTKFNTLVSAKSLSLFIKTDGINTLIKNKIKIKGTEDLTDLTDMAKVESLQIRVAEVMDLYYKQLTEDVNMNDFALEVKNFMAEQARARTEEVLATTYEMFTTPKGSEFGTFDSVDYVTREMKKINSIYSDDVLSDLETVDIEDGTFELITYIGLPSVDKDMRGIRRKQLIGLEADTGVGKTKFATGQIAYNAIMNNKSVLYYTAEQDATEIDANLVARHTYELYGIVVSHMDVLTRHIDSASNEQLADIMSKVDAARIDLFESGKYGKFKAITGDLFLETLEDTFSFGMERHDVHDIIIVDYMALIRQQVTGAKYQRKLEEYQIIRESYRVCKKFARKKKVAIIAVNQLNESGSKKAKAGQDLGTSDAQGGREVYKSPDYNITLVATNVMLQREIREIVNVKRRNSAGLERLQLTCKMACCYFAEKGDKL